MDDHAFVYINACKPEDQGWHAPCSLDANMIFRLLLSTLLLAARFACADDFAEVAFSALSDRNITALGTKALAIRPADWKHAETKHFVYHFFEHFVAAPASVEAEFYYTTIAQDLGKDTAQWERKSHIFIFERPEDWAAFRTSGALDPWTGGLHSQGELFVLRNAQNKWKGHSLGHEITHLVIYRFFGNGVPRWLNEGFAEYAGMRGYAAFYRARGFNSRPTAMSVDPAKFIPVHELVSMLDYPTEVERVPIYYNESERLVRYLMATDKAGFATFLMAMSQGNQFESALGKGFGNRFSRLDAFEQAFKDYATHEHAASTTD
jgi:hypothetical protein